MPYPTTLIEKCSAFFTKWGKPSTRSLCPPSPTPLLRQAGAVSNVVLAGAKAVAGVLSGSTALMADAFHSLADLVGDGLTLLTVRTVRKPPDEDHPYGHGKVS